MQSLRSHISKQLNLTSLNLQSQRTRSQELPARKLKFRNNQVLDASVSTAYRRYPNMEDDDIRFILDIVEGYRRDLKVYDGFTRKHDCANCR